MKARIRDGLWRELEKIAADLADAKVRGNAKAVELGRTDSLAISAFEQAWTERACVEGSLRIRSLCDAYLMPKRRSKKAA